jgi:competence protein ComEC
LALVAFVLHHRPENVELQPSRRRLNWAVSLAGLTAIAAAIAWWGALSTPDRRLAVTVLDVGQGDAILVETGTGRRILIDGGPSGSVLMQKLGRELPASARHFDLVVLTHAQDDHVTGLVTILERFRVDGLLAGAMPGETPAYLALRDAQQTQSVSLHEATAGRWADLGDGVRLEVLAPSAELMAGKSDSLNDQSVVLRLALGEVSFLLTGDIERSGETALLANGGDLRSTVLKVAHHGSDGSTLPPFLTAAEPAIAVISAGAENAYGHPSPSVLLRLAGIPILRTDENGSVRFSTDGRRLWVDFDRGNYRVVSLE